LTPQAPYGLSTHVAAAGRFTENDAAFSAAQKFPKGSYPDPNGFASPPKAGFAFEANRGIKT